MVALRLLVTTLVAPLVYLAPVPIALLPNLIHWQLIWSTSLFKSGQISLIFAFLSTLFCTLLCTQMNERKLGCLAGPRHADWTTDACLIAIGTLHSISTNVAVTTSFTFAEARERKEQQGRKSGMVHLHMERSKDGKGKLELWTVEGDCHS